MHMHKHKHDHTESWRMGTADLGMVAALLIRKPSFAARLPILEDRNNIKITVHLSRMVSQTVALAKDHRHTLGLVVMVVVVVLLAQVMVTGRTGRSILPGNLVTRAEWTATGHQVPQFPIHVAATATAV